MYRKTIRGVAGWVLMAFAVVMLAGLFVSRADAAEGGCCAGGKPDPKVLLRHTMHKLWAERGIWTRAYVVASLAGTPDASEAMARLQRNAEEIGNAFAPFFGMETAAKFTDFLRANTVIGIEVIDAARSGDKGKVEASSRKWHENAVELATFSNKVNSHWRVQSLADTLDRQLSMTLEQISTRQQKDWRADIMAADRSLDVMMTLAEGFAEGIIQQFPAKF
jgi:hypothetical protein